jgi:hypothetical protein
VLNPYAVEIEADRDLALLLPGFETVEDTLASRNHLVRALRQRGAGMVADRLERCCEKIANITAPCLSGACRRCTRERRRWLYSEMSNLLAWRNGRGVIATIVPSGACAMAGELGRIDLQRLGNELQELLAKVSSLPVVGAFDVSFNEVAGSSRESASAHYQAHAAVAILGSTARSLLRSRLVRTFESAGALDDLARRPLVVQPLNDAPRQLSYLLKGIFARRLSILDSRGRANTLSFPLKALQAAEIAEWLDSHTFRDRLILANVALVDATLVQTSNTTCETPRHA